MSETTPTASPPSGPLGKPRGILFVLLISLVTLGIYTLYWAYKTQEEMKQHTGDGLGGVLGLVVWIIISPVSAFVIPSEVGRMYARDGREPPVTGWTGLWLFPFGILIIPAIVWFVKVQGALNRYWESKSATAVPAPAPA
jgi:Na+/proline symporter